MKLVDCFILKSSRLATFVAVGILLSAPPDVAYGLNGDAKPDFIASWTGFGGSQGWDIATNGSSQMSFWSGNTGFGGFQDAVVNDVNGGANDSILVTVGAGEIQWIENIGAGNLLSGKAVLGGVPVSGYSKVSAGYLNSSSNISIIASNGTNINIFDYNAGTGDFDQTLQTVAGYSDVTAGFINDPLINGFVAIDGTKGDVYQMLAGVPTLIGGVLDAALNPVADIFSPELGNVNGNLLADLVYLNSTGMLHWAEFDGAGNFVHTGATAVATAGHGIFNDISLGDDADGNGFGQIIAAKSGVTFDNIEFDGIGGLTVTFGNAGGGGYENVAYQRDQSLHPVPEPMTMSLLGLGGLAVLGRKKRTV